MSDDLIWTGSLNDPYRLGGRVGLYDTTLRDGEQTVGVVLDPEQKLEIARLLDELGIDRIEAGFPRVSDDDWHAVELISAAGLRAEIWGFSRAVPADLEAARRARRALLGDRVADLRPEARRDRRLARVDARADHEARCGSPPSNGIHAAFFGVDSTRAEPDFYRRVYSSAVEAGAQEVVVVDTLGIASPEAVAELVGTTVELVGPDVPVHFHGHNDFGVATASAVAAVRAGAAYVQGTINGMGERAGNANLGEVALTLRALYGVEIEPAARPDPRGLGARAGAVRLRARAVEAGHRRDAVPARERRGREPVPRPAVDRAVLLRARRAPSAAIVLGKKSGLDSIRIKAEELGLDVPEERRAELLAAVKELGMRKRGLVDDDEFVALVHAGRRVDRAGLRRRRRRDRQPLRRPPRPGRRGVGAHPARGARARAERARASASPAAPTSRHASSPRPTRPRCPSRELVLVCCKGTDLEPLAARLAGHFAGRDGDDGAERPRRRRDRRPPRRLAAPHRRSRS